MNLGKLYFIDLFCGAGGESEGFHRARFEGEAIAEVLACVNHDEMAIASHKANHPNAVHFIEDIRTLDLTELRRIVAEKRRREPGCIIIIWASLECTNFSRAKGGLPRDADSRTLADHIFRYLFELLPDGLWIENVEEFMSWGPLDEFGKPISKYAGVDYLKWVEGIKACGWSEHEHRLLNAADYGAYTSRIRYFAQFMAGGLPITWPVPTHTKNGVTGGLWEHVEKWKSVRDVLDLSDEGESIFTRKTPLAEKTLERIYSGLIKEVAGGIRSFNKRRAHLFKNCTLETHVPFIVGSGGELKENVFLTKYYSSGGQLGSVNNPAGTLTTKDRFTKVQVIPTNKETFFLNPSWGGHTTGTDKPCPVIIARQDKAPMYLVSVLHGEPAIELYYTDTAAMRKIKIFMGLYGLLDIKMRMLNILELKRIQGFGDGYILKGSMSDQKKFIGNAVEVNQAKVLVESFYSGLVRANTMAA